MIGDICRGGKEIELYTVGMELIDGVNLQKFDALYNERKTFSAKILGSREMTIIVLYESGFKLHYIHSPVGTDVVLYQPRFRGKNISIYLTLKLLEVDTVSNS